MVGFILWDPWNTRNRWGNCISPSWIDSQKLPSLHKVPYHLAMCPIFLQHAYLYPCSLVMHSCALWPHTMHSTTAVMEMEGLCLESTIVSGLPWLEKVSQVTIRVRNCSLRVLIINLLDLIINKWQEVIYFHSKEKENT